VNTPSPVPGQIAVVTGAATGIGAELADRLAVAGHDLLLIDHSQAKLEEKCRTIAARHKVATRARVCELSDPADLASLVQELQSEKISVLCANAGEGSFGSHAATAAEYLHEQVMVNVVATHDVVHAVVAGMTGRRAGHVLLVGSAAGNQPIPGAATYAATKAFVHSLGSALRAELRGTGVTCTLLAPGPVRSSFARHAGVERAARSVPDLLWVSPAHAAAAGLDGLARGAARVRPGLAGTVLNLGRYVPWTALLRPCTKPPGVFLPSNLGRTTGEARTLAGADRRPALGKRHG
jgi:short-subunit dehydrogenase